MLLPCSRIPGCCVPGVSGVPLDESCGVGADVSNDPADVKLGMLLRLGILPDELLALLLAELDECSIVGNGGILRCGTRRGL